MQCVSRPSPVVVLVAWLFVTGALRWVAAKKVTTPPSPKGQQPASRHTRHLLPTSRAPMQKGVPDLWSYPLSDSVDREGSGLSIHARASPGLEPSRTTGPRVYKSSWNPRLPRATGPRVYKSSWTWIHRGQPALESATSRSARDHKGQPAPCLQKQF